MKLAIMQPYFMPYIGYFQLINAVDRFVIYDDIQYTKKGWINRNKILTNGKDSFISIPLKKDSDYLNIRDRYLAEIWPVSRKKILNKLSSSYYKAPHFSSVYPLLEQIIKCNEINLFNYLLNSIRVLLEYLKVDTEIVVSSTLKIDPLLRSESKVIEICRAIGANDYVNPIGGLALYDKDNFKKSGVDLHFIKSNNIRYPQFNNKFVSWLSIIDVLMFNSANTVKEILDKQYKLT